MRIVFRLISVSVQYSTVQYSTTPIIFTNHQEKEHNMKILQLFCQNRKTYVYNDIINYFFDLSCEIGLIILAGIEKLYSVSIVLIVLIFVNGLSQIFELATSAVLSASQYKK